MIEFINNNWISLVGALLGLIYLYLEYKANVLMWVASLFMAVFFIYIFYRTQLYASMVIYVYFFLASIYGLYIWLRKANVNRSGEGRPIRAPKSATMMVFAASLFSFIAIYIMLYFFTENPSLIKLGDALTTALNVVALWMMSKMWAEQWLLIIPANLLSSALLLSQGDILSSILFFIYFAVSITGYRKWVKLANT